MSVQSFQRPLHLESIYLYLFTVFRYKVSYFNAISMISILWYLPFQYGVLDLGNYLLFFTAAIPYQ